MKQVPKGYTFEEKEKENLESMKKLIKEYEFKKIAKECMRKVKKSDLPYRLFHLKFPH